MEETEKDIAHEAPPESETPAAEAPESPAEFIETPAAEAVEAPVAEAVETPATEAPESPVGETTETPAADLPPLAVDDLLPQSSSEPAVLEDVQLKAVLEAIVYVADEPLTLAQLSAALGQSSDRVAAVLRELIADFDKPEHGVTIREVAGGYKMATKAEHHDAVRNFVKSLKPPLKLSLPALETLAVIAYKQPVTAPEIMEIRGVQGAGVLKTLLDRKLIAVAGRKNVIGKPILYKTTREFLIQFGLKDMTELPSLKEFEEIRRMAFTDSEPAAEAAAPAPAEPVEQAVEPEAAPVSEVSPSPETPASEPETTGETPAPVQEE